MIICLQLVGAALIVTAIVLFDIAHAELRDPAVYRGMWICYRNRLYSMLWFVSIYRRCTLADHIMRLMGWPDPQWPLPKYQRPAWY